VCVCVCEPGSSVGIATDHGLDGPGSNPCGFVVGEWNICDNLKEPVKSWVVASNVLVHVN